MLVSCIMPTTLGRESLRTLANKCFIEQNWTGEKELIVELYDDKTIGAKLNTACEKAKGEIILRLDDDDWSAPSRITDQVNRLLTFKKSLTGYNEIYFWNTITNTASWYRGAKNYCLGTSMCFTKKFWEIHKFPDVSYGEDLAFYRMAKEQEDTIAVPADQMMVARLHGANCSSNKIVFPTVATDKLPSQFFTDMNGG